MILGKFMPPHAGHEYAVQLGRNFTSRLHVLVCSLDGDPIPGRLRYDWARELFPDTNVVHINADLPQEPADHPDFWNIWRTTIEQAVGEPIDYVFASEEYGHRLALELNARFVPVDLGREQIPVSGTGIRSDPLRHWRFIPECVRPFFVKRVCVFGPESTGKSTLACRLAAEFDTVHVAEFAREWLNPKGGVCDVDDIPIIARGQAASEDALARKANRILFCDTDLLLTTIWSEFLFGDCPDSVKAAARHRLYDLYLLMDVDAPWVDDGQRFLPHRRQEFFERCRAVLEKSGHSYVTLSGTPHERFASACNVIRQRFDPDEVRLSSN